MKIMLKYPSRSRFSEFKKNVELWESMVSTENEFEWVFSFDQDDPQLKEYINYTPKNKCTKFANLPEGKIAACNANVNQVLQFHHFDMIWLVSDDMKPQKKNFDTIITNQLLEHYPDKNGAVHINDGLQGLRLCTFSCIGVPYYKEFGYLYHPDYKSCYCDDEFTIIAWANRKMVWIPDVLVRHEWVGHTLNDELHQKNHKIMSEDREIFVRRHNAKFPKESVR